MSGTEETIKGKRILIVDDEKDILDTLTDLLRMCRIDAASSFAEARSLLETNYYDAVVLDIMGVDGFRLLHIANTKNIPALMLTAHALTEESLKKSVKNGASYFVPKEMMKDIAVYISDVLEAREKGKSAWIRWLKRLSTFMDHKFGGTDWREKEEEFWREEIDKINYTS
jgi:DNA-binding response OmpR family regulator